MEYRINQTLLSYQAQNPSRIGTEDVLLDKAIDLTTGNWKETGFTIEPFYSFEDFQSFQKQAVALLSLLWKKSGLQFSEDFLPEHYHLLANSQEKHLLAIEQTKLISTSLFPMGIEKLEERISKICGQSLEALNPFDGQSVFHFRVIRPQSKDNNPLHRDVWLEDYKDCINLYIPIAGSNVKSSLIIVPNSHHWPESRIERTISGAEINNVKFNVPAVTAIKGEAEFIRPDPKLNEVLVFSPYLIHGGASNLNEDITRISIELRLWKKTNDTKPDDKNF